MIGAGWSFIQSRAEAMWKRCQSSSSHWWDELNMENMEIFGGVVSLKICGWPHRGILQGLRGVYQKPMLGRVPRIYCPLIPLRWSNVASAAIYPHGLPGQTETLKNVGSVKKDGFSNENPGFWNSWFFRNSGKSKGHITPSKKHVIWSCLSILPASFPQHSGISFLFSLSSSHAPRTGFSRPTKFNLKWLHTSIHDQLPLKMQSLADQE